MKFSSAKKSFLRMEFMPKPASNLSNVPLSDAKAGIIESADQYAKSLSKRSSGVPLQYWREARTEILFRPLDKYIA
jgi:hypothetical protein